jgi:DNA-binding NarL/FixJ family response regulator
MNQMDILVVDDHAATREEMRALIEDQRDLKVVGVATNGEDAVRQVERRNPGLVVMDVVMPAMNGIDAARAIRASGSTIPILALSNHIGAGLVEAALAAGMSGYVRKDQACEELIPAIRAIAAGKRYVGKRLDG